MHFKNNKKIMRLQRLSVLYCIVFVYPASLNFRISFPKLELLLNVFSITKNEDMTVFFRKYTLDGSHRLCDVTFT